MASSLIHTTIFQGAVLVTATAARTTLDYRKYIHDSIWVNLATLSSG
jgi:hypothetical protein